MSSAPNVMAPTDRQPPGITTGSMSLRALLAGVCASLDEVPEVQVDDLTLDSREVGAGTLFVALPGMRTHGIGFARQAIAAGAGAIAWEPADGVLAPVMAGEVPMIAIDGLSRRLGEVADRFFGAPSAAMQVIGVTGTNGKTTTAHVLAEAFQTLGRDAGYMGTLGHGRLNHLQPASLTTADAISVHRHLAQLRDDGASVLGMEVSSHALDQHRVGGVRFDIAIHTNLTRDHLDYHGSLAAYAQAKARLFKWPGLRCAIVNVDDELGRELAASHAAAELIVYSRRGESQFKNARALFARSVNAGPQGLQIEVDGSWGAARFNTGFVGEFNAENLLAALAALLASGITLNQAVRALERTSAPPGRMQTLQADNAPLVIIDYAHTPDALSKALSAARQHCSGQLVCVFGCGGDRDAGKRAPMGEAATGLADAVIVTDDNPRTEDGDAIVADILVGTAGAAKVRVVRDRAAAINAAIANASAGDVVLIAGKGHEDYQILGTTRISFSDQAVAQAALEARS